MEANEATNRASKNDPNPQKNQYFFRFMSRIKFRSTLAVVYGIKDTSCLIDSGGTRHFFHDRSSFINFQSIDEEIVKSASATSKIVGNGELIFTIVGVVMVEAYHTPHFSTNIISVGLLTKRFKVRFTCHKLAKDNKSNCLIS